MKIVACGDIHGWNSWKKIVSKESDADKIIFIGDYFDSRGHSPNRQIVNFKDILELKRSNPRKVVLLFGNHDFHYIKGINEHYDGYQFGYAHDIGEVIEQAIKENLVQMCFKHDRFLFTHAGLTKTWAKTYLGSDAGEITDVTIQVINDLFKFTPRVFKFRLGDNLSQTGDDVCQSPIWVRPASLLMDAFEGVTHVVGHTQVPKLWLRDDTPNLIIIDCLGSSREYLVIENNTPRAVKIEE